MRVSSLNAARNNIQEGIAVFTLITFTFARWLIEARPVQVKLNVAYDLFRCANWVADLRFRAAEYCLDVGQPSIFPRNANAIFFNMRHLCAEGRIPEVCMSINDMVYNFLNCAELTRPISDDPTKKILHAIKASLDDQPLFGGTTGIHAFHAEDGLFWPATCNYTPAPEFDRASFLSDLPATPGRERCFYRAAPMARPFDLALTDQQAAVQFLHHNLTELELPTMEACAKWILEFDEMPWPFVCDMARQCWDEARHAGAFLQRLKELGGTPGDFSHSHLLWEMTADQPLAVRLAIHQRMGEWIGIDGAIWNANRFRAAGDEETAEILDYVAIDEISHVAFGNKWINILCVTEESRYATLSRAKNRRTEFGKHIENISIFPFNRWACARAGFTASEVDAFERNYSEHGSRFPLIKQGI